MTLQTPNKKQRFFVMDNYDIGSRFVFEIYEGIDRVLVLITRVSSPNDAHHYETYTMDEARRIWRNLFPTTTLYTRNKELESQLNASR